MERHHISSDRIPGVKCIDIYLDHKKGKVEIVDALTKSNRITISAGDWNQLINRIRAGKIGKIRR